MRDPKDQLRSFEKSALREHGFVKGSTMTSSRKTLSLQELADVIAYLSTLKGVVSAMTACRLLILAVVLVLGQIR